MLRSRGGATLLFFFLLCLILLFGFSKLVFVLSVRRLQRKLARDLNESEVAGQMNRARIISVFVSVLFSYLYNLSTIGMPTGG